MYAYLCNTCTCMCTHVTNYVYTEAYTYSSVFDNHI